MPLHKVFHFLDRTFVRPVQCVQHLVLLVFLFVVLSHFEVVSGVEAVYVIQWNCFLALKES